ncbi:glycosyltransferase [Mariniblastus fucicola]|uniref:D-inositol 3-phosphate glycosyltransferase n=1 Tax=Mariniblastus fucicola TaxID=980251 RepID=A0A5B9PBM0_9BACT|nr:glycosyltransferase [Mariniblastus fucicola]QEG22410.1 D-inositol 3-phosphate glycosyltransferase [Mariniblastus fucicola]
MKVSHFNTFPYGGAATAARRLSRRLRKSGVRSTFYYSRSDRDDVVQIGNKSEAIEQTQIAAEPSTNGLSMFARRREKKRLREIWRLHNEHIATRPAGEETFSMARLPDESTLNWFQINSDIVHLHWISFFADYPSFFRSIPDHVPLVWTLHDQNAFTGGCHYAGGCEKYQKGCGSCPQVTNAHSRDVSVDSFQTKRRALSGRNVHVVAPSRWMLDLAKQSPVWPRTASFHHIRLGFNLKKFYPVDRIHARKQLGIRSDAFLIGFGADDVRSKRKGVGSLVSALDHVSTDQEVEGIVFGSGEVQSTGRVKKFHELGYVDSIDRQRLIYSAADVVVVPSTEDNQPQVGLEAMACGTPVVGFDTCGIPEMVQNGKTGLLAKAGDSQDLAKQISWIINNPLQRQQMGIEARKMMELNHDSEIQAAQYIQLYENATQFGRKLKAA